MAEARFVVGIDLGTTHTVVAFCDAAGDPAARVFALPQLVTATEVVARPLLPSALFAPVEGENVRDPWGEPPWVTGEYALRRGAEVPGRLVASAKSWLCHAAVDRTAPILPWGGADTSADIPRISPLAASARYLAHVRDAWDSAHPEHKLADQEVVLTVPASFDEAARELTLQAAAEARLGVRLLEEPQAAFYDYMQHAGQAELEALASDDGALVLVCDVGGGTTDLSLIRVTRAAGEPLAVARVAVGRHLLLGGDNMDLALAHASEARLVGDARLEPARFAQLVLACRAAKEKLLGDDPPDDVGVGIVEAGARLVGGARTTRITRGEAEALVLEGFFPAAPRDAAPQRVKSGLVGFGLPYERDVAITRHVAAFFARHAGTNAAPRALLLNGGVFKATSIARRLALAIDGWGGPAVQILPHADPDLAVARGAVAYALARRGRGLRILGGSARGYYVEVEASLSAARTGVCVVPRGAQEGVPHVARTRPLALVVGRLARFELFASDDAQGHFAGDVVAIDDQHFDRLPPVAASFPAGLAEETLMVVLEGELSAVGTLDLACVESPAPADRPPRRLRLAFALRGDGSHAPSMAPLPSGARPVSVRARAPGQLIDEARAAIDRVLGKGRPDVGSREVKDLVRELERLLGERRTWTTPIARAIFDEVWAGHRGRRRSPEHERVFWQLAGYCLRPGFGDPLDASRVACLATLAEDKLAFGDQARAWQQFWIAWRRVAAGLDERSQVVLRDMIDPVLAPAEAKLKKRTGLKRFKPEGLHEMLEMASSLERVPAARRAELGAWVLERTWTDRDPRLWAAIGRLGARIPAYASVDHVVSPTTVGRWIDHLLREKWAEVPTAAEAAARMARFTEDRGRDLPPSVRAEVAGRLAALPAPIAHPEWARAVTEKVDVEERDRLAFFGEEMPVGLRLV